MFISIIALLLGWHRNWYELSLPVWIAFRRPWCSLLIVHHWSRSAPVSAPCRYVSPPTFPPSPLVSGRFVAGCSPGRTTGGSICALTPVRCAVRRPSRATTARSSSTAPHCFRWASFNTECNLGYFFPIPSVFDQTSTWFLIRHLSRMFRDSW